MAAVSSRYARALADVIVDAKIADSQAIEQLNLLASAFQTSAELRELWETPAVKLGEKLQLLDALVQRIGISQSALRDFVAVLIEKERVRLLPEIAQDFVVELNQRAGRLEASITSARELTDAQRAKLVAGIARHTGKQILPHYTTDKTLLGGVVVRVGSTIYDGSVRGQLDRIRQQLIES